MVNALYLFKKNEATKILKIEKIIIKLVNSFIEVLLLRVKKGQKQT